MSAVLSRNVTEFQAGPWESLAQHVFTHGERKKSGKLFLSEKLESNGMEISLNRLEPGEGYPFFHKHKTHEEIYIVISGRGEFQVDGETIPVEEGSVLRMAPDAVRTNRAAVDSPLCYVCIQAVAETLRRRSITDGELVQGEVKWA